MTNDAVHLARPLGARLANVCAGRASCWGCRQLPELVGWAPKLGVKSAEGGYGRYCSHLSRGPPAGNTCLSLTSRAVSSAATETPFTSRTRPIIGGSQMESVMSTLHEPAATQAALALGRPGEPPTASDLKRNSVILAGPRSSAPGKALVMGPDSPGLEFTQRRRTVVILAALTVMAALLALPSLSLADQFAGNLDASFNARGNPPGTVATSVSSPASSAVAVHVAFALPLGKTLVAGLGGPSPSGVELVQYNVDGSLDRTFGVGGKVFRLFSGDNGALVAPQTMAVTRLPTARLMIVMQRFSSSTGNHIELLRLMPNGAPDTSFGVKGKVAYVPANMSGLIGGLGTQNAIASTSDGKIVVGGSTTYCAQTCWSGVYLLRFNGNGSIDKTFNHTGVIDDPSIHIYVCGLAVQVDKKVVIVGSDVGPSAQVIRYTSAGARDKTFGGTGVINVSHPNPNIAVSTAQSVAVQADGKVVIAGYGYGPGAVTSGWVVVRLETNGAADKGGAGDPTPADHFGTSGGRVLGPVVNDFNGPTAYGIAFQTDGKIVVSGSGSDNKFSMAVVRYRGDGSIDTGFGSGGTGTRYVLFANNDVNAQPWGLVTSPTSGKIVVAGITVPVSGGQRYFAVARLLPN